MNENPIEKIRKLLNKEGVLNYELKDLLNECELSMKENIRKYFLNEEISNELYPSVEENLSQYNNSTKKIKQFNLNSLDTLNYLEKNNLKQDIVFIDFTQETFNIKGKNLNKKTKTHLDSWFGFITNRIEKIAKVMSDKSVVFISVDDEIFAETKLIADKYLSKKNFVNTLIFETPDTTPHNKFLNTTKEYVLIYKGESLTHFTQGKKVKGGFEDETMDSHLEEKTEKKSFTKLDRTRIYSVDYDYKIKIPETENEFIYAGGSKSAWEARHSGKFNRYDWRWTLLEEDFNKRLKEGDIIFKNKKGVWQVYKSYNPKDYTPYSDKFSGDSYMKGKQELENYFEKISKRRNKPLSFFKYLLNLYPFKENNLNILNLNGDEGSFEEAVLLSDLLETTTISVFDSNQNTYLDLNVVQKRLSTILEKGSLLEDCQDLISGFDLEIVNFTDKKPIDNNFSEIQLIENTKEQQNISENVLKLSNNYREVYIVKNSVVEDLEIINNDYSLDKEIIIYLKEKNTEMIRILYSLGLKNLKFI